MKKLTKSVLSSILVILLTAGVVYATFQVFNERKYIGVHESIIVNVNGFEGETAFAGDTVCGTVKIENIGTKSQPIRIFGTLSNGLTSNHWLFDGTEHFLTINTGDIWEHNPCVQLGSDVNLISKWVNLMVSRE